MASHQSFPVLCLLGLLMAHSKRLTQLPEERNASSLLEVGAEDVECFCIDFYEYVDFDDTGDKYHTLQDCSRGLSDQKRCNELCEDEGKTIGFEGKTQTLSFCGDDDGLAKKSPECHCLDGKDTVKHSNRKKAFKKYGDANVLTQFKDAIEHTYVGFGSAADNLAVCYEQCPGLCQRKHKLTGGCAMPTEASSLLEAGADREEVVAIPSLEEVKASEDAKSVDVHDASNRQTLILPEQKNASSVLEAGADRAEDIECFCIDYYEFVDFDDAGDKYASLQDCARGSDDQKRCNELCEDKGLTVGFEGKTQTLSFCGKDDGLLSSTPECQCMDGGDTFKHSNTKKALKKYGDANVLTQFKDALEFTFDGYGSAGDNLMACYRECPGRCMHKTKMTGGCAMPTNA